MKYDDILELEHYHEPGRPFMTSHDRAAQFMPFKSLRGYDELIDADAESILDDEWENIVYDEMLFMQSIFCSGRDLDFVQDDDGDVC